MARVSAMSDVPAGRYAAAGSDAVAADPADVDAFSDMLDAAPDRCCGREVEVPPERRRHAGEGGREGAVPGVPHGERQPAVLAERKSAVEGTSGARRGHIGGVRVIKKETKI